MAYTYKHPRPALTVDCVVFGFDTDALRVMLVERDREPAKGKWALPGGFVGMAETVDEAARRELREETGITKVFLEQLRVFSAVDRDPRERVVTTAYYALVNMEGHAIRATTDVTNAKWFAVEDAHDLPFDHNEILALALTRLRDDLRRRPIGFELLPDKFTLNQLQTLYEVILDRKVDKSNFRRKILSFGILTELDEVQADVAHRAARYYRFDEKAYRALVRQGFLFEL